MESRLTKLAAEMVRGRRTPRVLDYAAPDPPRWIGLRARLRNEVEYWGGPWYLACLSLGAAVVAVGVFSVHPLPGMILEAGGIIVILAARGWRAWRNLDL